MCSGHKNSIYFSQLSIDENGDIIEWPMIKPNDSAKIVVRDGFLNLREKTVFVIDLKASRKANHEIVKLFKKELNSKIV